MDKLNVLQIGSLNWQQQFLIPDTIEWTFVADDKLPEWLVDNEAVTYDVLLIDQLNVCQHMALLCDSVAPYRVLYTLSTPVLTTEQQRFIDLKQAKELAQADVPAYITSLPMRFYAKVSYGDKLHLDTALIASHFKGNSQYSGHDWLKLTDFTYTEWTTLVYWRQNLLYHADRPLEFWLEYAKEETCQVRFVVTLIEQGSLANVMAEYVFSQEQLAHPIIVEHPQNAYLAFRLEVLGSSQLAVGALHFRETRFDTGAFIPGGQRYYDKQRKEIFYYFHPGDMKPPLNVYFSGYRTLEGFEGYFMMERMQAPFLLISDPRLTGGSFYIGSKDIEKKIEQIILEHLQQLQFNTQQLILSGLSMGTFGALYYGAKLNPYAIVVGKPLVNLGDVALNETLHRPGGWPTSLDILQTLAGNTRVSDAHALNARIQHVLEQAQWQQTKIAVAYMQQDDYDMRAYQTLLDSTEYNHAHVMSKGIMGRHNDETIAIQEWFLNQYRLFLADFGRE